MENLVYLFICFYLSIISSEFGILDGEFGIILKKGVLQSNSLAEN